METAIELQTNAIAKLNAEALHLLFDDELKKSENVMVSYEPMLRVLTDCKGIAIDRKDIALGSQTLLHKAIRLFKKHWSASALNIINALLDLKPDVNLADAEGRTPLHRICSTSAPDNTTGILLGETVSHLLQLGSRVDVPDCTGRTPLMLASIAGLSKVVALLIEAGSPLNWVDSEGCTALHYALSRNNNERVLERLVQSIPFGLDLCIYNKQGQTPLDTIPRVLVNSEPTRTQRIMRVAQETFDEGMAYASTQVKVHLPRQLADIVISYTKLPPQKPHAAYEALAKQML